MTALTAAVLTAVAVLVVSWPASRRRPVQNPAARPRPTGRVSRGRADPSDEDEGLSAFLDVVAPSLRAGRTPEEAAALACEVVRDGSVVASVRAAVASGRSVASALVAEGADDPDARFVAQVWQMSARTGSPLADAVDCAAEGVRARRAHRRAVEATTAGARATIGILTLLPLGGPVLAVAVGVDPVRAYLEAPVAWGCLLVGAALVVLGRFWVARLVQDVARGPVLIDA